MTRKTDPIKLRDVVRLYESGQSVNQIAASVGLSRRTVDAHLVSEGVTKRTASEQNRIAAANQTASERKARVAAAHAAKRGAVPSAEGLSKAARTREANGSTQSAGERRLLDWLNERGEFPAAQTAVDRYNIDITISDLAVELLGGEWHRYKRTAAERSKVILDAGWHLLFIWNTPNYPLGEGAADYLLTFLEFTRKNPTAVREYRVIGGDGEFVAGGRVDNYDLTRIPAPRSGLSPSEVGKLGAAARWGNG